MRLGADRGLLDPDDKREPVKLNSLMSNFADQAGDFIGDSLGGIWSFMTNPSEERVEQANIDKEAIKLKRLTPDKYGNTPQAWMYAEQSNNPDKLQRFFENIPYNAGRIYQEGSRMFRVPEETIEPVGNLIAGGVLNLSGGLLSEDIGAEQRETANAFVDVVSNTFSSWDNFTDAIANNPLDFMAILAGGGYTAKSIADLAKNPAVKESFRKTLQNLPDPADLLANNKMTSQLIPDPRQFLMMWHGSPRNFTELDNKFMLTGEGNNVKGAGFYMGGRASTSKQYFGEIDKYNQTYDTTDFDLFQDEVVARKREADFGDNKSEIVSHMWKEVRDDTATPSEVSWLLDKYKDHPDLPKLKEAIKEYKELWSDQPFSLMKFDVKDEYVSTFLNDAKGVYDQPEAVKNLIRQENGAYMDLVEAYKKNSGNKIEQDKIVAEINALGDFPHPENGIDLYDFFVDRRAEQFPSADMSTHNLEVSKYLHDNGVMGRRWADDLSTKYPDLYDSENYLIFDAKTAEMFERNEVPVIPNPMIAQHNLTEKALEKHLENTGIPMPSIAISKVDTPLRGYGEIGLLASPEMITPSRDTKVYPTDMYSGRAPYDQLNYVDPQGVLDKIDPDILRFVTSTKPLPNPDEPYTGGGIAQAKGMTNREYINDKARRNFELKENHTGILERKFKEIDEMIERGFDPYQYDTLLQASSEIDSILRNNNEPRLSRFSSDMTSDELLGESIRVMHNPKGYRSDTTGEILPDVPYSAELALKEMRKKKAQNVGAENHLSANRTYALATQPFKNLDEIKQQRGILESDGFSENTLPDDDWYALLDSVHDELNDLKPFKQNKHRVRFIDEVLANNGITKELIDDMAYMPDEAKKAEEIVFKLRNRTDISEEPTSGLLATEYFEAKPNKIIDIAEFKGAIIPKDTKPKIIELLKQKGIKKILSYGSEAERLKLFKEFPELQFIGLAMPMSLLSGEEEQRTGLL